MDSNELKIRERELALKRRKQNLSAGKFVVGVVLLGVLSFTLDLKSFVYTQDKDDRDFLSSQRLLLQESNLQQRLKNIAYLDGISARKLDYLTALKAQTLAEIEEAKKRREKQKRTEERERVERERAAAEAVEQAKEAERQAEEEAAQAKKRADSLREEAQKAHDMALQEAYPNEDLFDLKRRGAEIP